MAGRRMIDAQIWESEQVASLTLRQRLLWIGLITRADDQGRGKSHPGLVRGRVFPYDNIDDAEMDVDIQSIANIGFIVLYQTDRGRMYQIVKWWEYQTPSWAWPSKLPAPEGWTDREKYRRGNDVVNRNWDGAEPIQEPTGVPSEPTVTPERVQDDPVVTSAPNGNGNGSINGNEEKPGATAPPPPPPPEPVPKNNTRKPNKANLIKAELEAYFSEVTALPKPVVGTKKQRTKAAQLWWNPLQQIAKQCDDDVESAKRLIDWTIAKMDQEGWNISSPNSILKTAKAEHARRKRGGVARNDGGAGTHQVDRNAEIINRAKERRRRANGDIQ